MKTLTLGRAALVGSLLALPAGGLPLLRAHAAGPPAVGRAHIPVVQRVRDDGGGDGDKNCTVLSFDCGFFIAPVCPPPEVRVVQVPVVRIVRVVQVITRVIVVTATPTAPVLRTPINVTPTPTATPQMVLVPVTATPSPTPIITFGVGGPFPF